MHGTKITDRVKLNSSGLSELSRSVALPKDNPARRLPTFPYVARTAVVALEHTGTAVTSTSAVLRASLTRFPSAPLWLTRDFPDRRSGFLNDSLFYAYVKNTSTTGVLTLSGASSPAAFISYGGVDFCLYPHGGALFAQSWGGASTIEAQALIFSDEDPGSMTTLLFNFTANTGAWTAVPLPVGAIGVHCVRSASGPMTDVWLHSFGNNLLWPVRVPVLDDIPLVYADTRCTSAAVLFSNVTRVLEKEGTIRAGRLIAGTPYTNQVPAWPGFWQAGDLDDIHPSEKYFGAMENGVYTFTLHTPESELFQDAVLRTGLIAGEPPVGNNGYLQAQRINAITGAFSALEFLDVDATSNTTLAYTLNYHLEFRTTNPVFEIGFSAVPIEAYHSATVALAATPVFYENPTHWRSLVSMIARGLSLAIPLVAPQYSTAARAIGVAGSLLAPTKRSPAPMQQKQMVAPAKKAARRRRKPRARAQSQRRRK